MGLILQAGLIVKLVLVVLVVFSLVSWAIIVSKWRELRGADQDSESFLEIYHQDDFNTAYDEARELVRSPVAVLFVATCDEMGRLARHSGQAAISQLGAEQMRVVSKYLAWTASKETQRLEKGLTFLATTGSSAVYIGLFGTVVGIIQAFRSIAMSGSASLAVVAPGIAEALIATAVGLVAAIPATIFYNHFAGQVDSVATSIGTFATELEDDLKHLTHNADALGTGPPSR
jgi:biopolymer transport protein TolQ